MEDVWGSSLASRTRLFCFLCLCFRVICVFCWRVKRVLNNIRSAPAVIVIEAKGVAVRLQDTLSVNVPSVRREKDISNNKRLVSFIILSSR